MPDKVYRTAIYCRLSREDGDKVESNSIASQRAICEDYIARHEDAVNSDRAVDCFASVCGRRYSVEHLSEKENQFIENS